MDLAKVKPLEEWATTVDARVALKLSKQGLHDLLEAGAFDLDDLRSINAHPVRLLIRKTALAALVKLREEAEAARTETARALEQETTHRRLLHDARVWLRSEQGGGHVLRNDRPVPDNLMRQYRRHLRTSNG